MDKLIIGNKEFSSRLFLGTGKFGSEEDMINSIKFSGTELVTFAIKRVDLQTKPSNNLSEIIKSSGVNLLPNTSGARTAKEAIFMAQLACEALETKWIKLEIHPDPNYLLPDGVETLLAATELVKLGYVVLPYINADPVLCKRLEDIGIQAVMPLGAPIGTNKGLETKAMLKIIIEQSNVPVIVDAGIGAPSHASEAMEMGASAVLVNTAIAVANSPKEMANAFKLGVEAGRLAFLSGLGAKSSIALASSPLLSFLD